MGKSVEIKVDLVNREKLRRLHTATHIVNFSAREVLGNHVWQNGSNLKAHEGTLDITHYDGLSLDEIFEIEKVANRVVFENREVTVEELDRTDAEKKYGYTIYQGGAIPMKKLRIVRVLDSDIEACGGIHMQSTGGIGLIKIIDSSKIQDGVVRLKFVVNEFALDYISSKQKVLDDIKNVFSTSDDALIKTSQKFFDEWKEQRKEIDKLKDSLKKSYIDMILKSNFTQVDIGGDYDMAFMMELFNSCIKDKKELLVESNLFAIGSSGLKPKSFKKEINKGSFVIYVK